MPKPKENLTGKKAFAEYQKRQNLTKQAIKDAQNQSHFELIALITRQDNPTDLPTTRELYTLFLRD